MPASHLTNPFGKDLKEHLFIHKEVRSDSSMHLDSRNTCSNVKKEENLMRKDVGLPA
jgi:hypothetical protein